MFSFAEGLFLARLVTKYSADQNKNVCSTGLKLGCSVNKMYSQYRDSIWNKIRMKNSEMNRSFNRDKNHAEDSVGSEWDLSQIELQEERSPETIPTIELEDDDDVDVGISPPKVRDIPIRVERSESPPVVLVSSPTPITQNADSSSMVRRPFHDHRDFYPSAINSRPPAPVMVPSPPLIPTTPAGIILNRVYHKNPTPQKDNYFSFMDTPPSPGALPASVIFGDRPVSSEPKIGEL